MIGVESYLEEVIHEHLAHFVNRNCCIDRAIETTFSKNVWQCTKMVDIWLGYQNCIYLTNMSENTKYTVCTRYIKSRKTYLIIINSKLNTKNSMKKLNAVAYCEQFGPRFVLLFR